MMAHHSNTDLSPGIKLFFQSGNFFIMDSETLATNAFHESQQEVMSEVYNSRTEKLTSIKNNVCERRYTQAMTILESERVRRLKQLLDVSKLLSDEAKLLDLDRHRHAIEVRKRMQPARDFSYHDNHILNTQKRLGVRTAPCYLDKKQKYPVRLRSVSDSSLTPTVRRARASLKLHDLLKTQEQDMLVAGPSQVLRAKSMEQDMLVAGPSQVLRAKSMPICREVPRTDSKGLGSTCYYRFKCDSMSSGLVCDSKSSGLACDSKSSGLMCGSRSSGLVCDSKSSGLMCDSKSRGLVCDSKSSGLVCDSKSSGLVCGSRSSGLMCGSRSSGLMCGSRSSGLMCGSRSSRLACDSKRSGLESASAQGSVQKDHLSTTIISETNLQTHHHTRDHSRSDNYKPCSNNLSSFDRPTRTLQSAQKPKNVSHNCSASFNTAPSSIKDLVDLSDVDDSNLPDHIDLRDHFFGGIDRKHSKALAFTDSSRTEMSQKLSKFKTAKRVPVKLTMDVMMEEADYIKAKVRHFMKDLSGMQYKEDTVDLSGMQYKEDTVDLIEVQDLTAPLSEISQICDGSTETKSASGRGKHGHAGHPSCGKPQTVPDLTGVATSEDSIVVKADDMEERHAYIHRMSPPDNNTTMGNESLHKTAQMGNIAIAGNESLHKTSPENITRSGNESHHKTSPENITRSGNESHHKTSPENITRSGNESHHKTSPENITRSGNESHHKTSSPENITTAGNELHHKTSPENITRSGNESRTSRYSWRHIKGRSVDGLLRGTYSTEDLVLQSLTGIPIRNVLQTPVPLNTASRALRHTATYRMHKIVDGLVKDRTRYQRHEVAELKMRMEEELQGQDQLPETRGGVAQDENGRGAPGTGPATRDTRWSSSR